MVTKIEAACKKVDAEFTGWMLNGDGVTLNIKKNNIRFSVPILGRSIDLIDQEEISSMIQSAFCTAKVARC